MCSHHSVTPRHRPQKIDTDGSGDISLEEFSSIVGWRLQALGKGLANKKHTVEFKSIARLVGRASVIDRKRSSENDKKRSVVPAAVAEEPGATAAPAAAAVPVVAAVSEVERLLSEGIG